MEENKKLVLGTIFTINVIFLGLLAGFFYIKHNENKMKIEMYKTELELRDKKEEEKIKKEEKEKNTDFSGKIDYKLYLNKKYGYKIDYPITKFEFSYQEDDGSGITLQSEDYSVKISLKARDGDFFSLDDEYQYDVGRIGDRMTYKRVKEEEAWYVVSYDEDSTISYYKKVLYNHDKENLCILEIRYPKTKAKELEDIITKLSRSFKKY